MLQDLENISQAIGLFHKDDKGLHLKNKFLDIQYSLQFNDYFSNVQRVKVDLLFKHAWQDINNISVLIERIEWVKNEAINGQISDDKWRDYTRIDIEHFHTELRSAMDYVNEIISYFSRLQGQWPGSYNRTLERIESFKHKVHLEIYQHVIGSKWFSDIRYVRDSLVHYGGNSLVFGSPSEGVLFQIYDSSYSNLINKPYLLYNEHVVYFEKCAALYVSNILVFLDTIGDFYLKLLNIEMKFGGVRMYNTGYSVTYDWLVAIESELKEKFIEQNISSGHATAMIL